MSIASPVWKVLCFGNESGRFSEAVERKATFPDDDPDALLLILQIAHLTQHYNLPAAIDIHLLCHLAIQCDKYDCGAVLGIWVRKWADPFRDPFDKSITVGKPHRRNLFKSRLKSISVGKGDQPTPAKEPAVDSASTSSHDAHDSILDTRYIMAAWLREWILG